MKHEVIEGEFDVFMLGDVEYNEVSCARILLKLIGYWMKLENPYKLMVTYEYPMSIRYHFELEDRAKISHGELVDFVNKALIGDVNNPLGDEEFRIELLPVG